MWTVKAYLITHTSTLADNVPLSDSVNSGNNDPHCEFRHRKAKYFCQSSNNSISPCTLQYCTSINLSKRQNKNNLRLSVVNVIVCHIDKLFCLQYSDWLNSDWVITVCGWLEVIWTFELHTPSYNTDENKIPFLFYSIKKTFIHTTY